MANTDHPIPAPTATTAVENSCCKAASAKMDDVPAPPKAVSACCASASLDDSEPVSVRKNIDWMLWSSLTAVVVGYGAYLGLYWDDHAGHGAEHAKHVASAGPFEIFAATAFEMINLMWWGILLGFLFVGLLDRVPRVVIVSAFGRGKRLTGILRATAAGILFDLCSHGILMVGAKFYERGASIGQTVAFLLASPWNSLSLTVVLIALVGWWYTLLFIALSALIGITTGLLFDWLVEKKVLPDNPARAKALEEELPPFKQAAADWLKTVKPSLLGGYRMMIDGVKGSQMVLRWLMFGIVLAGLLRAVIPPDAFAEWFGPTMLGVFLTVMAATLIEVCSEGSAPIASDLVTRAGAPGNGFAFLMAGVASDYTEIMVVKDTTRSWKLALMIPVIAVPQTLFIAVLINAFSV